MLMQLAPTASLMAFTTMMIYAALQDASTMMIRNRLVLTLVGAYVVCAPLVGFDMTTMALGFATGAVVLAITFTLFAFGLIGGGDAKFAAATAIWLGPQATPAFLVYAMLIGGGLAIVLLALRRVPLPGSLDDHAWIARLRAPETGIPYALAMAPAALLALPTTTWFAYIA